MMLLPQNYWEIKTTEKKGRGVFAKKDIKAGTVIGDYIGKVVKTAEEETLEEKYGLYLMYYHDRATLFPTDVNAPGIHLINHACMPNTWVYTYKGHTLYFALRQIFAGEELTVSYLLSSDECEPCTHQCTCESVICSGTMHMSEKQFDAWNDVNLELSAKTKRKRITYGKVLPLLDVYPENIPDHPIYTLAGTQAKPPLELNHTQLPTIAEIRKHIRESGRTLSFPKIGKTVLAVQQSELIMQPSAAEHREANGQSGMT